MKTCNQKATEQHLQGDERQQFMSTCLTGKEPRELSVNLIGSKRRRKPQSTQ